jgi:Fis family transcriptional regulator
MADPAYGSQRGSSFRSGGAVTKSVRNKTAIKKHTLARTGATAVRVRNRPLRDYTEEALQKYFGDLNGHRPGDLYEMVLGEVEEPLFKTVLDYTKGNQSVAAEILGINRATLRKKLRHYQLLG